MANLLLPRPASSRSLAPILAVALLLAGLPHLAAGQPAPLTGRFLFAGDDDWDWATPLGAEEPSKLVRYGVMPWSALDWAEEGLVKVRGAFVGTAPEAKKTMTMEQLSDLRGENATYRHHAQVKGVVARLLEGDEPPNLIVLMQNTGRDGPLDPDAIAALIAFVKSGGRLVVLDDWEKYHPVLDAMVAAALALPPGPPIPEAPEPVRPDPLAEPAPAPPEPKAEPAADLPPDPAQQHLREKFAELLPKLADESFKVREDATAAIRALGPEVVDLFDALETDDPEIASRLAALRRELRPPPAPNRQARLSQEAREAQRLAKLALNAKLVRDAAVTLTQGKVTHRLSTVLVDGDKRPLPVLRISFPSP